MSYGRHAAVSVALASRWGLRVHRLRWWIVAIWLLAVALGVPALSHISENLTAGGFEVPGSQSEQVKQIKQTELSGDFVRTDVLVLRSDSLTAGTAGYHAAVRDARAALLAGPGVAAVTDPYNSPGAVSASGDTVLLTVGIDEPQDQAYAHAPELEGDVDAALAGGPVQGNLAGDAPFYAAFQQTGADDLATAEMIVLPLSVLILVLALGGLVAAIVPLVLAGTALAVSLALVSVLAQHTTVNLFTQNIATMIGLGVGIDYCLFLLRPFRQALRAGEQRDAAVAHALASSGRAILVSALTVVLALSGTLVVDVPAYRSMGLGALIAVAVAAAAALTLLPALMGILGSGIERGAIPRRAPASGGGRLGRLADASVRRPWLSAICALGVLCLLALPALRLQLGTSGPSMLPADAAPRVAAEQLADGFGAGMPSPVEIVVRADAGAGPPAPGVLRAVRTTAAAQPEVIAVAPPQVGQRSALVSVVTRHGPQSPDVLALVERLRATLPGLAGPGNVVLIGGEPAQNLDLNDQVGGSVPLVVGAVLALSFLLLLLAFRSIFIAAKAVLTTLMSVLAVYGVLVLVFQDGHGASLLSVQAPGFVEVFLPLFLFCILFGLSMDYEVFLLSEVRSEYLAGASCADATRTAVGRTAGVITTAATIMVGVFGAFAFTSLTPIKAIGFGLAVAVLLDATVVRLVLVPAVLVLLGDRNFWLPRWLQGLLPGARRPAQRRPAAFRPSAPSTRSSTRTRPVLPIMPGSPGLPVPPPSLPPVLTGAPVYRAPNGCPEYPVTNGYLGQPIGNGQNGLQTLTGGSPYSAGRPRPGYPAPPLPTRAAPGAATMPSPSGPAVLAAARTQPILVQAPRPAQPEWRPTASDAHSDDPPTVEYTFGRHARRP